MREITVGHSSKDEYSSFHIRNEAIVLESLGHEGQHRGSANNMKKTLAKKTSDDLRPEYDLSKLKGGVRGKYHRKASAGTNLVLIEPELTNVFPNAESVNRALKLLADTAASATRKARRRGKAQDKRLKRSA
jgi:hypothetical protein